MNGWRARQTHRPTAPGAARLAARITRAGVRSARAAARSAPCSGARPALSARSCRPKCGRSWSSRQAQRIERGRNMFETTLAGSLPKPSWLATPNVLWAPWTLSGQPLFEAKDDATLLAIRRQEEAGIDIVSDGYYGDRVKMAFAFAELLNQEARDLERLGVDVIQFDEPAFNVYLGETVEWGVPALEKAAEGLKCTTAVHICYGYGIEANIKWKETLGESWRQYEQTFPALDRSKIQQVSLECRNSHVPPELMKLLKNKTLLVGAIDVASDKVETPEEVAETLKLATKFVDPERIQACTNCGMAPMTLGVAYGKLRALAEGAALARKSLA